MDSREFIYAFLNLSYFIDYHAWCEKFVCARLILTILMCVETGVEVSGHSVYSYVLLNCFTLHFLLEYHCLKSLFLNGFKSWLFLVRSRHVTFVLKKERAQTGVESAGLNPLCWVMRTQRRHPPSPR